MSYLIKSDVIEALNEDLETSLMCYEDENTKAVIRWCYDSIAKELDRLPEHKGECSVSDERKISREHSVASGRAAFFATIYDDLKSAAVKCGWALGLHGSLANDMDIMAMPWTEDAVPVEEMIRALSDCFDGNPFKECHSVPYNGKPNGRVVYTMLIWGDMYLDINVIQPKAEREKDV